MRVEFAPTFINPFSRGRKNERPVLITSSLIRSQFAGFSHIPINNFHPEVLERVLEAINKKEEEIQGKIQEESGNHHSISEIRRSPTSPLILLELATHKAKAAFDEIKNLENEGWEYEEWGDPPTSFATVDSAWAIDLTPENPDDLNEEAVFIQKPKDNEGIDLIIENLKVASQRGGHLQSVSAVCRVVIKEDGTPLYQHSLVVVDYGKLNPDFNWQKLANLMANNGHFAGGFSTKNLFSDFRDLVEFGSYAKVQIIVGKEQPNDKTVSRWDEFVKNQEIFELSIDATNIEQLIAMSIGLVPQS